MNSSYLTFCKIYIIIYIENRKEIKMMNKSEGRPISPLQRLYNIEKTLFPNMEKIKSNIDDFEEILIEIYSNKENRKGSQ